MNKIHRQKKIKMQTRNNIWTISIITIVVLVIVSFFSLSNNILFSSGELDPDLNGDGVIDNSDLEIIAESWGCSRSCEPADINEDGEVDVEDIELLVANYNPSQDCPNGVQEPYYINEILTGEQCDDGNSEEWDGCSSYCRYEAEEYEVALCDTTGDLNNDFLVNELDLDLLFDNWNCEGICAGDVNEDEIVNLQDLLNLLSYWGESVCCGNGVVEGWEDCDDGNSDNADGCNTFCIEDIGIEDWVEKQFENLELLGSVACFYPIVDQEGESIDFEMSFVEKTEDGEVICPRDGELSEKWYLANPVLIPFIESLLVPWESVSIPTDLGGDYQYGRTEPTYIDWVIGNTANEVIALVAPSLFNSFENGGLTCFDKLCGNGEFNEEFEECEKNYDGGIVSDDECPASAPWCYKTDDDLPVGVVCAECTCQPCPKGTSYNIDTQECEFSSCGNNIFEPELGEECEWDAFPGEYPENGFCEDTKCNKDPEAGDLCTCIPCSGGTEYVPPAGPMGEGTCQCPEGTFWMDDIEQCVPPVCTEESIECQSAYTVTISGVTIAYPALNYDWERTYPDIELTLSPTSFSHSAYEFFSSTSCSTGSNQGPLVCIDGDESLKVDTYHCPDSGGDDCWVGSHDYSTNLYGNCYFGFAEDKPEDLETYGEWSFSINLPIVFYGGDAASCDLDGVWHEKCTVSLWYEKPGHNVGGTGNYANVGFDDHLCEQQGFGDIIVTDSGSVVVG